MANDGLVTDPELFPSWANDGDNIYQWTDSKNAVFLVPTTVYNLLTQPWRGQANCNRNLKNAAKSVLKLYQKNAILWLVHISHVAPKWGLAVTSFSLSKYFRHRKPDGNHVANCQAFQHNIACIIARNFSGYRSNF